MVDVDRLFTNIESLCIVSAELLQRLRDAIADPDPETQLIGTYLTNKHCINKQKCFIVIMTNDIQHFCKATANIIN